MTSPVDPPERGTAPEGRRLLAVTACPTGIAHTYMAAEKLAQAAQELGYGMKVETQGSIGAENVLSDAEIREADGIIVAADKDVDLSRFAGKRVLSVGVAEGIRRPERLIRDVLSAPVHRGDGAGGAGTAAGDGAFAGAGGGGRERGTVYKALMNGVSYMIPFVVVGGLLISVSLALGGRTTPEGIVFDSSFWQTVNDIGAIGFALMIPVLSGYIAYAIGDRPALVPGMVGGWIASHGELYDSEAGAGFIGAIATGFLAGHLVVWIKKVRVPAFVRPIMPVIVIPIVATTSLGLFFVYVIGRPIAWVFAHLTTWLGGLTGTSAALLGVVLGLMIAFDMGGPVNKTAFLFGAGLVSKNPEIMGMCAAAIPVPPLGQGLATLLRRGLFSKQEQETGAAALFMGFFGITEGAIPFAAARPARVIPANMCGGAVAGAIAGLAAVADNVPHGGPIVAVLGAVDGVAMFFVAIAVGTVVTALTTVGLMAVGARPAPAGGTVSPASPALSAPPASAAGVSGEPGGSALSGYLTVRTVRPRLAAHGKEAAIREMAGLLAASGHVADVDGLVSAALAREEMGTTGLGEEIAIPHAKTDAVSAPVVGFARSEGIEWGALDGTKARLIFMIAVPGAAAGDEHLRILAMLSRKLMDPAFRERLLSAGEDAGALVGILREVQ
ncbi:fructose-specific PTS transporter subunit EIIC [Streptomyces telluris]|uniref:Fructose-specific PTS transporter subunit EIIC n=1 Tax=Streptomyces telluris TaxID=2720021 RepID=A0A9X2LKR9_9ACTN|nr:fructose-specific PTS transporter subunit EIIC [Streptomyces telluris]MCQ8772736.1 fructose-specific PTS transporter subunit EIIC [Streptomyces telluris]NJP76829.1 PTS transporter subunit EIIA [Streptomyces telluris]